MEVRGRVEELGQHSNYSLPEEKRAMMCKERGGCARAMTFPEVVKLQVNKNVHMIPWWLAFLEGAHAFAGCLGVPLRIKVTIQ